MKTPIPFGKYQLVEEIAVGGMAEIFKAIALGMDGQQYTLAIKRILPQYSSDEEFISMMIDEAKVMVLLNHPNIVPIIEFGKIEDSYFIAMEYIQGITLKEMFKRVHSMGQKFSIDLAVHIIREIGTGLAYAHRKADEQGVPLQIVHRDISPANILISFEGDVRVTDFGIAKASNQSHKTQVGIIRGKTGYMSPEQTRANTVIDQRSDIYSMGAILYELLTAERLFKADSVPEALKLIRESKIPPLKTFRSDVPAPLEEILMKALSLNPENRFVRAEYLVDALNEFLTKWSPKGRTMRVTHTDVAGFLQRFFTKEIENISHQPKLEWNQDVKTEVHGTLSNLVNEGQTKTTQTKPKTFAANPLYELSEPEKDVKDLVPKTVSTSDNERTVVDHPWQKSHTASVNISGKYPWLWDDRKLPLIIATALLVVGGGAIGTISWLKNRATRKPIPSASQGVEREGEEEILPTTEDETIRLLIKTSPSKAKVFVDGKALPGRTPLEISPFKLDQEYTLRIEAKGYETIERVVKKKKGGSGVENYVLTRIENVRTPPKVGPPAPLGPGARVALLSVKTEPWSYVYVNDKLIGPTPLVGSSSIRLPRGVSRIKYVPDKKLFKYKSYEFKLTVKPGDNFSCLYNFTKPNENKDKLCKKK